MTPQDFQTLVKDARKRAGLTQQDLADRVGVGKPTINQFEVGKQNITLDVLCRILTALDVHLSIVDPKREEALQQITEIITSLS